MIYKASNWRYNGRVKPDYQYIDKDEFVCNKKTLWNKAKKMGMSEKQYCKKFGYSKIWGLSKERYVLDMRNLRGKHR